MEIKIVKQILAWNEDVSEAVKKELSPGRTVFRSRPAGSRDLRNI